MTAPNKIGSSPTWSPRHARLLVTPERASFSTRIVPIAPFSKPYPGLRISLHEGVVTLDAKIDADAAKKILDPALLAGVSAAYAGGVTQIHRH